MDLKHDFLFIGSTPPEENCAQVGSDNYYRRSRAESFRYIDLIRTVCGPEPEGAQLKLKWQLHDFGSYVEVVCWYEEGNARAMYYAHFVEAHGPMKWSDDQPARKCACQLPIEETQEVCDVCSGQFGQSEAAA